jgi:LPXTG-motif cell wall-anchored protein
MKAKNLLILLLALGLTLQTAGQKKSEIRDMFNQGEMFVLFEEYNEALPFYLNLLSISPDNAHYKYRIGQCYINIPGEKEKAVPYLEDAVRQISDRHKEGRLREKNAPYDALYYLANAYRINNQLDKAIDTYERFMENMDHRVYDSTIVQFQLQTCFIAKDLMTRPLYVKSSNLGDNINDRYSETNPVVSAREEHLFFTRVLPFRRALFWSQRTGDRWSGPVDIITQLNVDDKFYPTSLSHDGKTLYLYSDYDFVGNIYVSRLVNGEWTPVEKLNENINTKYWESHAVVSPDGKKLYFSSNRRGGYGGLDIFVSELDSLGDWGPATNLGPAINTPYHEDTPFLTEDGKTLFFSSRGHYNMGGFDIFYSSPLGEEWSVPLNAGYPLNTTDDDLFFMPLGKGYEGFIARFDDKGYGRQDIFRVEIFSDQNPRRFMIEGIARIQGLRPGVTERVKLTVRDLNDPSSEKVVWADPATGRFEFDARHGTYEVKLDAYGATGDVKKLSFPLVQPGDTIGLGQITLEKADYTADLRVLSDLQLRVTSGNPVEIILYTEPRSLLDIVVMNEGVVTASERFEISDTSFIYSLTFLPGINEVGFELTDMYNNTASARVVVERVQPVVRIPRPELPGVLAVRQVSAFLELLRKNADEDLRNVIADIDPRKHRFENNDEVVSLVSDLAGEKGIDLLRVEKLALKTAVTDNILTQSAVDLLAKYASGELKNTLNRINIYDLDLNTWNALRNHVNRVSEGRITGEDLDRLADFILTGPDPAIALIKEKIGVYAPSTDKESQIMSAVAETDGRYFINAGEWLESFYKDALAGGLTVEELNLLLAGIAFAPGTEAEEGAGMVLRHSEENLALFIEGLDMQKLKIRNVVNLMNILISERDKTYSERDLFSALAATIAESNLSASDILEPHKTRQTPWGIILPVAGLLLLVILLLIFRRKKKDKNH